MIADFGRHLRLLSRLSQKQRRSARQLLGLTFVGMLLEMLGVGLIVPVIVLLMQQDTASMPSVLTSLLQSLGPISHDLLVTGALLALAGIYTLKSAFLSYLAWRRACFAFGVQAEFAQRLFAIYLAQPYVFHLRRNSAQLIRNASSEIVAWAGNVAMPGLLLLAEVLVMVGLSAVLLVVEPVGTITVIVLIGVAGLLFHHAMRHRNTAWGTLRQYHEGMRIQHLQQSLGSIKEVKLLGREAYFVDQFSDDVNASAQAGQKQTAMLQIPGLWLELMGVAGLVGLVLMMMSAGRPPNAILPTIGLFAAVAFRIMPSVNRVLGALQQLRFGLPASDALFDELRLEAPVPLPGSDVNQLPFQNEIVADSLSYTYEGANTSAVNSISLRIAKGESIGIIGPSGSGKSTLVDLLLGLMLPQAGYISVDGQNINANLRGWHKLIGYVPQTIYLTDDSLRRNIALGVPEAEIDDESVTEALRAAQLTKWVTGLPDGLETRVGERGVRISGGQRQRVGIARALYHRPEILVLDEATSALDSATEKEVIEAVVKLRSDKTIVMVAHRLSTLAQCDRIYKLEHGNLREVTSTLNASPIGCVA